MRKYTQRKRLTNRSKLIASEVVFLLPALNEDTKAALPVRPKRSTRSPGCNVKDTMKDWWKVRRVTLHSTSAHTKTCARVGTRGDQTTTSLTSINLPLLELNAKTPRSFNGGFEEPNTQQKLERLNQSRDPCRQLDQRNRYLSMFSVKRSYVIFYFSWIQVYWTCR